MPREFLVDLRQVNFVSRGAHVSTDAHVLGSAPNDRSLREEHVKGHDLDAIWTDTNWPFKAEQDLAVFLHLAREFFESNPTNQLPAFEVLD
jgi:hypothetical protein